MQHHNALKVDSEYSLRLLQNDDRKALNSKQKRTALPLEHHIQMLSNSSREKGELEGVASTEPSIQHQSTNPT
ncbi:hypothetical protein BCT11_26615 [Vibrio sp. 10N.222.52.B12]|nr:hypothetical protein BCT11_26615 [Vibrio sp. 10N.222.52.B12]